MMSIVSVSALVMALFGAQAGPVLTAGPGALGQDAAAAVPGDEDATEAIGFRNDAYDRMTVGVTIAGRGPYRFMVDTGADRSAISRTLADRLQLKARAPLRLHSAAGVSQVNTVRVHGLQFETRDQVTLDAPILEAADMGADGILGVDALRTQRIILDFKQQRVFLTPTMKRERKLEPGEIVVRGTLRRGHLVLTNAKMFGEDVTIIVDTGAQFSIGNPALYRLLRRAGQVDSPLAFEQVAVTGAILKGQLFTVTALQMNEITLRNLSLMIADAQTFKALGRRSQPTLLLGMNALRAFDRVEIDLKQKRMRLKYSEAPLLRAPEIAGRPKGVLARADRAVEAPIGRDCRQWLNDERPACREGMRHRQPARAPFAAAPGDDVEIEDPRPPALAAAAAEIVLDLLEHGEHRRRIKVAFDQRHGIGEIAARGPVRGIEDDRRGVEQPERLVERGDRGLDHLRRSSVAAVGTVRSERDRKELV